MKRCKVCKGLHDVRGDGLCGGCYDNRMAAQFGMSYGKYVAKYGHNYQRDDKPAPLNPQVCPVCGAVIVNAKWGRKYCSDKCRGRACYQKRKGGRT